MKIDNFELTNFYDLNHNQKSMVLEWRNNENIKKWMYGSSNISKKDHFDFCDSLQNDNNKRYFLVSKDHEYLGVVYFTGITEEETCFGLYANPETTGVGRILESISIKYAFDILKVKKLSLEVFSENKQVANLHKKYNFHVSCEKTVNNKKVICMELKNENR